MIHLHFSVGLPELDLIVCVYYNCDDDRLFMAVSDEILYTVSSDSVVSAVVDRDNKQYIPIAQVETDDMEKLSSFMMVMEPIDQTKFTDIIPEFTTPLKLVSNNVFRLMDNVRFIRNLREFAGSNYYLWFEVLWFIQLVYNEDHRVLLEMKEKKNTM